jgi:NAD-dependent deacetylase
VLTGAGLSAESGLGIFREGRNRPLGFFEPMRLATPEAFASNPGAVHALYNAPAAARPQRRPGPFGDRPVRARARLVLCKLNIDNLHRRDGSRQITHMHVQSKLLTARCLTMSQFGG